MAGDQEDHQAAVVVLVEEELQMKIQEKEQAQASELPLEVRKKIQEMWPMFGGHTGCCIGRGLQEILWQGQAVPEMSEGSLR